MEAKFNELLSFTKTNFMTNYLLYLNVLKVILLVAFIFYSLFKKNNNLILNWNKIKQDFELLINKYKNLLKFEKNIDEIVQYGLCGIRELKMLPLLFYLVFNQ